MPAKKPRVLVVTRNLPPLTGGIERLTLHVCNELIDEFDVHVCGPTSGRSYLESVQSYRESPPAPLRRFLAHNIWQALKSARVVKPDLIYAGSGLTAPAAQLAGRLCSAKTLVYLHGLDIVTRHPVYKSMFMPAIRAFDGYFVNSRNTKLLAANAGVPTNRIRILHPGVEMPDLIGRDTKARIFRQRIGAENRPILVSVGRLTARKGIAEFIDRSLGDIARKVPNVLYVVIGEEPRQAISGKHRGVKEQIQQAIRRTGTEHNVLLMGRVDDAALTQAFFASHLHIFPVLEQQGDVEGFGMVAIEAAAHGLPTVAFSAGGIPDAVSHGVSGYLIEPGNYQTTTDTITAFLEGANDDAIGWECVKFARQFSWHMFGKKLRGYFWDVLTEKR